MYCSITDLGFYLNGELYCNNSIVNIGDIGVGGSASLHCLTDRRECCESSNEGNWFLPGQVSPVTRGETSTADFSSSKASSSILLNRRSSATGPVGLYHCQVPDSGGVVQSMYIGLYGDSGGELQIKIRIVNLFYHSKSPTHLSKIAYSMSEQKLMWPFQ